MVATFLQSREIFWQFSHFRVWCVIQGTIIPSLVASEVYHWTQKMESSWMLGCSIHQHRSREVKPDVGAQHCSALWPGWHCIVVKWLLHCTAIVNIGVLLLVTLRCDQHIHIYTLLTQSTVRVTQEKFQQRNISTRKHPPSKVSKWLKGLSINT